MSRRYSIPTWDSLLGAISTSNTRSTPTGSALNALSNFDRNNEMARQRSAITNDISAVANNFDRYTAQYGQEFQQLTNERFQEQDQAVVNEMQRMMHDAAAGMATTTGSVYPPPRHETMPGDARVDPESNDLLIYDGNRWVTISNRKENERHIALVEQSIVNLKTSLREMEAQARNHQALRHQLNPDIVEEISDGEFKDLI